MNTHHNQGHGDQHHGSSKHPHITTPQHEAPPQQQPVMHEQNDPYMAHSQPKHHKPAFSLGSMTGPSKVYIVEFLMMHIAYIGIIISNITLINVLVEFIDRDATSDGIYYSFQSNSTLIVVAIALVSVPLFFLTYIRTRKSERLNPALTTNRRRRNLLYLFLSGLALTIFIYVISFVYSILVWAFSEPDRFSDPTWVSLINISGALVVLAIVFMLAKRRLKVIEA